MLKQLRIRMNTVSPGMYMNVITLLELATDLCTIVMQARNHQLLRGFLPPFAESQMVTSLFNFYSTFRLIETGYCPKEPTLDECAGLPQHVGIWHVCVLRLSPSGYR
jgi:hypothetical protein